MVVFDNGCKRGCMLNVYWILSPCFSFDLTSRNPAFFRYGTGLPFTVMAGSSAHSGANRCSLVALLLPLVASTSRSIWPLYGYWLRCCNVVSPPDRSIDTSLVLKNGK